MRKMIDSGIEWIGEIPQFWNIKKIGQLFRYRNIKVNDTDYPPLSVTKSGIVPQMDNVAKSDANDNRKQVLKDDFVINSRSDRKQSCGLSNLVGSVSLINTVLYGNGKNNITPKYTGYLLKNYGFAEEFYRWGHGIVADLWTTGWQDMKNILLPVPSFEEQNKIIECIECSEISINKLIFNQEQQIDKLKQYKQSLITEVVTKGLNPNAPMKDSGIDWMKKMPAHWNTVLLSSIVSQRKNKNTGMKESNLLSLSYGNVIRKNIKSSDGLLPENFEGYNIIESGDIVLRLTDLQNDHTSLRTGLCTEKGIITSAYVTLNNWTDLMLSEYLHYYLHSFDIYKGFYGMGSGVRQGLTFDGIKKLILMLPPLEEQQEIVEYLDSKCSQIDKLIEIKQEKIEKLEQYKKSLIYEYVTGKKEAV